MTTLLQKDATVRTATASAIVQLNNTAFQAIATDGKVAKGDALTVAQLAGSVSSIAASHLALSTSGLERHTSGLQSLQADKLRVAAGIMGAKQTSQLIPLCHNIPLDSVNVELRLNSAQQCVHIEAMAKTQANTGCPVQLGPEPST